MKRIRLSSDPLVESSPGLSVASDKVLYYGESVIIYATREMPDWQVREFCKIPIYFEGRKFYLLRKARMEPPYVMGYELEPWPEDLHEESNLSITYDQDYVAQRNRLVQTEQRNDLGRLLLLPLFPFLGFLWARFKDRTLERFGFHPVSMTNASLLVEFGFFVIETIFLFVFHDGFAQVAFGLATAWLDYAVFVVFLVDMIARYDQVLRGIESPPGFLEWLVRFVGRKTARRRADSRAR